MWGGGRESGLDIAVGLCGGVDEFSWFMGGDVGGGRVGGGGGGAGVDMRGGVGWE